MFDMLKSAFLYGKDFCEDTAENIKETVTNAVDCAKLHYRIVSKRNDLNNLYAILGKLLMTGVQSDDSEREQTINSICERINKKEELLAGLLEQYRLVSGKVICPDCGRFMSERYTFCPYCGNHVSDSAALLEADVTDEELLEVQEIDEL